ncbi:MAG: hypothetical protein QM756_47310 [Polyangiaceae bacterium]
MFNIRSSRAPLTRFVVVAPSVLLFVACAARAPAQAPPVAAKPAPVAPAVASEPEIGPAAGYSRGAPLLLLVAPRRDGGVRLALVGGRIH